MPAPRVLLALQLPLQGSGSGEYVRGLGEALRREGCEVAVCAPDPRPPGEMAGYPFAVSELPVFLTHPELEGAPTYADLEPDRLDGVLGECRAGVAAAVRAFRPDVVHVQHASVLVPAAEACREELGVPFVVTAHGTDTVTAQADRRYVSLVTPGLARARAVSAVSDEVRRELGRLFGLRRDAAVTSGGVDSEFFHPGSGDPGADVVLYAGRLDSRKGVDLLIRAAPRIAGSVVVVGGGREEPALRELAGELGAPVRFTGYVDDREVLRDHYARASVVVVPSRWEEPFALTVLEAMACGTPVAGSRTASIARVVDPGHNGELFTPGSAAGLADAVNSLLGANGARPGLAENARATARAHGWANVARRFLPLYGLA